MRRGVLVRGRRRVRPLPSAHGESRGNPRLVAWGSVGQSAGGAGGERGRPGRRDAYVDCGRDDRAQGFTPRGPGRLPPPVQNY